MIVMPASGGTAHPHALHVPIIACKFVLFPGLEPPGCKSGPRSTFLVGYAVIFSLTDIFQPLQAMIDSCLVLHGLTHAFFVRAPCGSDIQVPHLLFQSLHGNTVG